MIQKIIQFWKEFRYKKTFIFGCFVIFVYFYDFAKDNHGFYIENGSDQNITILEIVNDDRRIVALREIPIPPNQSQQIGCSDTLSINFYGGSTLQVTFKNEDNSIQTASCVLERSRGGFLIRLLSWRAFFTRLLGNHDVDAIIDKDGHLKYKLHYTDGGPYCDKYGISDKIFQFK